ncbi:MAG: zinc ribbon domain-containing protein [Dehalococcoidia bacterium]|nr:MAG: zinc ribbon domain-containing protein [Dehalococcoidia bacterium]
MKCLNCNHEIDISIFSQDLSYCPYCGQELGSASIGEKLQFCPYCGKKLTEQTNFCPHCGKKLALSGRKLHGNQLVRNLIGEKAKKVEVQAKTVAKAIKNTFGRERKIRKLYKQWADFSDLPPEEIPSVEELKKMSTEGETVEESQSSDED